MAKQIINVGTSINDGTGDVFRTAFQKTNSNFTELYDTVNTISTTIDRTWNDTVTDLTFNTIEWNSGSTVEITSTPFETYSLTTYDARTDSNYIYFIWDQTFITDIWEGNNHPIGEGTNFSISFDNGTTWYAAEKSGYNGNTFLYFAVPFINEGFYTFTYVQGITVLLRYNRGSNPEIWFDLANAPVDSNTIVSVAMDTTSLVQINSSNTIHEATIHNNSVVFSNSSYNPSNSSGGVNNYTTVYSGNSAVYNSSDLILRKNLSLADKGRLYCVFDNGSVGTITTYWHAKLFVRS